MKLRQQVAEGKLLAANGAIAVDIKFDDGTVYPEKGRLLFADPTVNETTGQITLRAAIPNDRNILMPGLYVRVLMEQVAVDNAFVVPQQAVTRGSQDTVMVVNDKSEMEARVVTIAQQQGSNWVITDGLKDGDKVMLKASALPLCRVLKGNAERMDAACKHCGSNTGSFRRPGCIRGQA